MMPRRHPGIVSQGTKGKSVQETPFPRTRPQVSAERPPSLYRGTERVETAGQSQVVVLLEVIMPPKKQSPTPRDAGYRRKNRPPRSRRIPMTISDDRSTAKKEERGKGKTVLGFPEKADYPVTHGRCGLVTERLTLAYISGDMLVPTRSIVPLCHPRGPTWRASHPSFR